MMFREARYCPACGSPGARWEADASELPCPTCRTALLAGVLRDIRLHECPKCFGIWLDSPTFEQICQNAEKQVSVLGRAQPLPARALEPVRYRPCPGCRQLMHRMNFAKCSGVIVDVCRSHGVWFDMNELHQIVRFIHEGGLARSRDREKSELAAERRRLLETRSSAGGALDVPSTAASPDLLTEVVSAAGDVFVSFL
jgi:Zn-finger nucleic acid-binding protein